MSASTLNTKGESSFLPKPTVSLSLSYINMPAFCSLLELIICLERAYFVLDTNTGVIHIFKKLDQEKPSESFSLSGGSFPEKHSNLSNKRYLRIC